MSNRSNAAVGWIVSFIVSMSVWAVAFAVALMLVGALK
jgi:hypothetical protein